MSKEERNAYFNAEQAATSPVVRILQEEDLMRHCYTLYFTCAPFDPTELVALAQAQLPTRPEVAEALARCTQHWPESRGYSYFQDPVAPDRKHCSGGFFLHCPRQGELLFDTDADGGIIGVEYLSIVMRGEEDEEEPLPGMRIVHWKG